MREQEWKYDVLTRFGLDPEDAFRDEQFKGAQAVDKILLNSIPENPCSLLLEAPTGTGKTLMYLGALRTYYPDDASETSPSDDSEIKAVVSTSGKLLQHQIAEAAKKLGISHVVLMGRANYLCSTACHHYLETMPEDHPLYAELRLLCQWLDITANHEIRDILKLEKWSEDFRKFMRHHLTASSAYCRNGHEDKTQGSCYFTKQEAKAAKTSLVILNHHALFSFENLDWFKNRILIADEAHAMPEAASSVFTRTISTRQFKALIERAEQCRESCFQKVKDFQRMLLNFAKDLQDKARGEDIVVPTAEDWNEFYSTVTRRYSPYLTAEPFGKETIRRCDPFHGSMLKELNASWQQEIYEIFTGLISNKNTNDGVRYFETDAEGEVSLKYAPIETAPLLKEFWSKWSGTIGLSATLTMPGASEGSEFDYFRNRCGFPKPTAKPIILKSPFDLEKQCRVFIPATDTDYDCRAQQDPERFLKSRIELTGTMIQAFNGRTLALYTATSRLAAAAAVLKPLFPDKILAQGDGDNDALADEFVRDPEKSLLGSRSFFQGFDAPGETLSCEILEKLPFRRKDDPVQEEQCRRAEEKNEKGFKTVVLPAMLMELRQAFGRLIRKENDHGIFILNDPRFWTKEYSSCIEKALGGISINEFKSAMDLLKKIPKDFLCFPLEDITGFPEKFAKEWNRFRETPLFRRVTGLRNLADILKKLKIEKLYDWQKAVIDNVLKGVPAQFIIQPAGSGKSLTYQIPALMRPGLTLVISPLKSLMFDQVMSLKKRGISEAEFYNSDLSDAERRQILDQLEAGSIRLLYVAPERLHCKFIEKILNLKQGLSSLVIDEAHMISEAGSQWRPLYGELRHAWEQFGRPQILALTATAGKIIKEDIQKQFEIPDEYVFERSVVRERVKVSVKQVPDRSVERQKQYALDFVRRANGKPVLIYCSKIRYIYDLQSYLQTNLMGYDQELRRLQKNYPGYLQDTIEVYHTGSDRLGNVIPPSQLEDIHQRFLTNRIKVLIATSAYGMGIDKPDIWGVLFNNVPSSLEELVQGWGRVCRDVKLLREYEEEGHPPEIAITFNMRDVDDQSLWKIRKPFQDIEAAINQILTDMTSAARTQPEMNFSRSCRSYPEETLDEDIQRACILLARFMRDRGILKSGSFDWSSSEFHFSGISDIPDRFEVKRWLDQEEHTCRRQLISVLLFADDKGCRNEFLQTYFSGSNSNRKCRYCDRCGYDLNAHLAYVKVVQREAARNISPFERGVFSGDNAAFLQYLQEIPDHELSAQIAYLDREHRESGLEHSDAEYAAALLEMRQNKNNAGELVRILSEFIGKEFARFQDSGMREIFFPFAADCGIPDPAETWKTLVDLHDFICRSQDAAVPQKITDDLLQSCSRWDKKIQNITGKFAAAIRKWVRQTASENLNALMEDPDFRCCVDYIRKRDDMDRLIDGNENAETWTTLTKYLLMIVEWEMKNDVKFLYLCDLIKNSPHKDEWARILSSPNDYLKMAKADPRLFEAEKQWEPIWFSASALAQSRMNRCLINRENIIISELDLAAGDMPIGSWLDLLDKTPCTAKFCPEWKKLLETLDGQKLRPDFSAKLPPGIADIHRKLNYAMTDFLKRKISFRNTE